MGSTRLPGKVLKNIKGKPMVWHLIDRLKNSKWITEMVIATTIAPEDDAILHFCEDQGVECFRGSELDVLDRYYQAAQFYATDIVVRITSDCPLIDVDIVDCVIEYYKDHSDQYDGASNAIKRTFPRGLGVEVFSMKSLKEAWLKADKSHQREHVSPYIYEHPEKFRLYSLEHSEDLTDFRWTVDEQVDLDFVREVYGCLYKESGYFGMDDILELLEKEPNLKDINKNVQQKIT